MKLMGIRSPDIEYIFLQAGELSVGGGLGIRQCGAAGSGIHGGGGQETRGYHQVSFHMATYVTLFNLLFEKKLYFLFAVISIKVLVQSYAFSKLFKEML